MQWSLDQARANPLWRGLTEKERNFFELLEEHELDDAAAAVEAFDLQPQSVQVRLNQLRAAIDTGFIYRAMMGFAVPSREEVIAALWQLHEKTKDEARKYSCLAKIAELIQQPKPRKSSDDAEAEAEPQSPQKAEPEQIPDLTDFKE